MELARPTQQAVSAPLGAPSPTQVAPQVLPAWQKADWAQQGVFTEQLAPEQVVRVQKPFAHSRPEQQSESSPQPWFSPMQVVEHVFTRAPVAMPQKAARAQHPPAAKPALQRSSTQLTGSQLPFSQESPVQHCSLKPQDWPWG